MTIQEAIKSGRPFKRKSSDDPCWMVVTKVNLPGLLGYEENEDGGECPISETHVEDLLADDWILKPWSSDEANEILREVKQLRDLVREASMAVYCQDGMAFQCMSKDWLQRAATLKVQTQADAK